MKMKALVCDSFGSIDNLEIREISVPVPSVEQMLIKVSACGINYPDSLIVEGKYQFKPTLPFSPGAEICGVVEQVGEKVNGFKVGDRVMAGTTWGGLAQYVLSSAENTYKVPDEIDDIHAAVLLMTYGTSYHALVDRARIKAGETLLVLGSAGGVGTAAIQIGRAMKAHVIAAASTAEKLDWCTKNGANKVLNYEKITDLKASFKAVGKPDGIDVIFDPVGGRFTEPALRAINNNGRHLILGFTDGSIPQIPMNLPLLKSASLVGVFWSNFVRTKPQMNRQNIDQIIKLVKEGKLAPGISKRYPLEDATKAIKDLKYRKVLGKVVVTLC